MANLMYPKGREGILDESVQMNSGDIRAMLVKSDYSYDPAHKFVADMGAVDNGRSPALANKTFADGVFDADDTSLVATSAEACSALVYFQHTGDDATARLICFIDSPTTGLPFTPAAGQSIGIEHSNAANRIFKL